MTMTALYQPFRLQVQTRKMILAMQPSTLKRPWLSNSKLFFSSRHGRKAPQWQGNIPMLPLAMTHIFASSLQQHHLHWGMTKEMRGYRRSSQMSVSVMVC
jgi:hypothetical protein